MASITALDQEQIIFTTWRGHMKKPQNQQATDQRLGSGSVLAYVTSSRAELSQIQVTVLTETQSEMLAAAAAIESCQGRVCDVTDAFAERFPQCWCHKADVMDKRAGASATGKKFKIEATFELEVLEQQAAQNTIQES